MLSQENEQLRATELELKSRSTALVILEVSIFVIAGALILVGNSLTVYIIWKDRRLWTITNAFVVSLAVSDFCMAALNLPLCLAANVKSSWPFGDTWCQYQGYICLVAAIASIQNLTWMAVNRYFRVVKPQKYQQYFNSRSTKGILFFIWLTAAISPLPYLLAGNKYVFFPAKFLCVQSISRRGYMTSLIVGFHVAIPAVVITGCYCRVFSVVRQHNSNFQHSTSTQPISVDDIKITRTLFALVVLFLLCWAPIFAIDFIDTIRAKWGFPREVYVTYGCLAVLSSLVNPICYGVMNPSFRRAYLKVFANLTRCNKTHRRAVAVRPLETEESVEREKVNVLNKKTNGESTKTTFFAMSTINN